MQIAVWVLLSLIQGAHADIVGGEEVGVRDPIRGSTVGLYQPSPGGRGGALCTASLIGSDMAVTAAHCLTPGGSRPVVLFGRNLHAASTVKRPVTGARVNPKWRTHAGRGMDQGDIAVVQFPGGLPPGYAPAQIAGSDQELTKGRAAILAGYGITNAQTQEGAGILRRTEVKIANPRSGKSEMIMDQCRGHGACHGDSGGPAFIREKGKLVLAGVTNRSHPARAPDDCAHRSVYTKVNAYRPWIQQSERELRARPSHFLMTRSKAGRATRRSSHRAQ